mmetsp:Transcript_90001/g.241303  ORF Transcript_90001/g.241303 Transcript_90001/m.241303 type:complete len:368 (-) Transcript_90001:825-1928(-)
MASCQLRLAVREVPVLMLDLLFVDTCVLLGLRDEFLEFALRLLFLGGSLRLELLEIRENDLQKADNTAALPSHASVRLIESLWGTDIAVLEKGSGLPSLLVEVTQDFGCLLNRVLRLLGLLDGHSVLGLLFLTVSRSLGHCFLQFLHQRCQVTNLVGSFLNVCLQLLNLRVQLLHGLRLRISGLLVRAHFRVTPALVFRLFLCLLHELLKHVLNHLLDLAEDIVTSTLHQLRQHGTVELGSASLKERNDLGLQWRRGAAPQLHQADSLLVEAVLLIARCLAIHAHFRRRQHIPCLVQSLKLLLAELLTVLKGLVLHLALGLQLTKVGLVLRQVGLRVPQFSLRRSKALSLLLRTLLLAGLLLLATLD